MKKYLVIASVVSFALYGIYDLSTEAWTHAQTAYAEFKETKTFTNPIPQVIEKPSEEELAKRLYETKKREFADALSHYQAIVDKKAAEVEAMKETLREDELGFE